MLLHIVTAVMQILHDTREVATGIPFSGGGVQYEMDGVSQSRHAPKIVREDVRKKFRPTSLPTVSASS
jgi:hypothetical protein